MCLILKLTVLYSPQKPKNREKVGCVFCGNVISMYGMREHIKKSCTSEEVRGTYIFKFAHGSLESGIFFIVFLAV